jgi:hypothetical protein
MSTSGKRSGELRETAANIRTPEVTKNTNSTVTEKEEHKKFLTCLTTELNVFKA